MFGYILTGIGAAVMTLINSGSDDGTLGWIIALVCAGIGIFLTIREAENRQEQLMDLAFHLGAFIIGVIAIHFVAVVIALFVLAIFLQFMGINVFGWLLGQLDRLTQNLDSQEQIEEPFVYVPDEAPEEEAPAPKVEVWRENGYMRENLKVSSDGERYYDPEDGEWHNIK